MMAGIGRWLLGVIAVSILCAGAQALMPEGAGKQVGKLVCGLLLLTALLPLGRDAAWSQTEIASAWVPDETELKQAALQLQKAVIEREYAAYIEDKAAERGLECTAQVTCRETDGLLLPWAAAVSGSLPAEEERWLVRTISADLGVPLERQQYEHKEAQP